MKEKNLSNNMSLSVWNPGLFIMFILLQSVTLTKQYVDNDTDKQVWEYYVGLKVWKPCNCV